MSKITKSARWVNAEAKTKVEILQSVYEPAKLKSRFRIQIKIGES